MISIVATCMMALCWPRSHAYPVLSVLLRFALTIIHGCGRAAKNGEGLVSLIM